MIERYTMENKPSFEDGQYVLVDMGFLGWPSKEILMGKIVGKGLTHVIDTWLVKFERSFAPEYPFQVVGIPHLAIIVSAKQPSDEQLRKENGGDLPDWRHRQILIEQGGVAGF